VSPRAHRRPPRCDSAYDPDRDVHVRTRDCDGRHCPDSDRYLAEETARRSWEAGP
jgi:hypothetical protein